MNTKPIIEKWYRTLLFPKSFDKEFYEALEALAVSPDAKLKDYDLKCTDGKRNLLHFLYFCEEMQAKYMQLGLPEEVLLATLEDLVIWTKIWSEIKNELYLGELYWLSDHLNANLFRLGRLQFCKNVAAHDLPALGVVKGEPVVDMHIPAVGPLTPSAVEDSLLRAKAFYAEHFPDYGFRFFTCSSWLLDPEFKRYLPENSNILAFGNRFTRGHTRVSDSVLHYVFRWDASRETLDRFPASSSFAKALKEAVARGDEFHATFGAIPKEEIHG